MKRFIPNFFSMLNLVSGSVGIILALQTNLVAAVLCIFIGGILDFLDGFFAKVLKADSLIGKELDSLADLITFGLLPTVIMFILIKKNYPHPFLPFVALCIVCASAFRLAKFNIDENQKNVFIGLPTPANALFIGSFSLVIICNKYQCLIDMVAIPFTLPIITMVFSWLLVSPIKFMSLKFTNYKFWDNKLKYTFLMLCIALVINFCVAGITLCMISYIILSIFFQKFINN